MLPEQGGLEGKELTKNMETFYLLINSLSKPVCCIIRRDENRMLRRAMKLQVEGRRSVGRPEKMWSKVVEEDMGKLNIMKDMAEDRKQWTEVTHIMSSLRSGKLEMLNKDDNDDHCTIEAAVQYMVTTVSSVFEFVNKCSYPR